MTKLLTCDKYFNKMSTQFIVKFNSVLGQNLFISGNTKKLGGFDEDKAVPMKYIGDGRWSVEVEIPTKGITYKYLLKDTRDGSVTGEWQQRTFKNLIKSKINVVYDEWFYPSLPEFNLSTELFKNTMPSRPSSKGRVLSKNTHRFSIKMPLFNSNEKLCVSGAIPALGEWNPEKPVLLKNQGDGVWYIDLDLSDIDYVFEYKYAVYNEKEKSISYYEIGENRYAPTAVEGKLLIINDVGFRQPENKKWRGSGVAVPVFSLRSKDDLGVGEFLDLIPFGQWAKKSGFSLIQLLPIHDTTANHTWTDCYPYAAISVYALHPMFLNLESLNYKLTAKEQSALDKFKKEVNKNSGVEYVQVNTFKNQFIKEYFAKHKSKIYKNKKLEEFIGENAEWLKPYAIFCTLRDENGTADFKAWKKNKKFNSKLSKDFFKAGSTYYESVMCYSYVQWHLHLQLSKAVKELHKMGLGLKGDLPIGIYRNSVDAWQHPELFHMDQQAGAPPDDFAVLGQNWEFPTYNWVKMRENDYKWWKSRFQFMSRYFDAFRIDHILGFFRIWQIPMHAVQGILGRFEPALPVTYDELRFRGIHLSHERLVEPFLPYDLVRAYFEEAAEYAIETYFEHKWDGELKFKTEYNTQRKIQNILGKEHPHTQRLLELAANVLFIKEEGDTPNLHPRYALQNTNSYAWLSDYEKMVLNDVYTDYFYSRQESFWREKGLEKLPALKQATNMLTCGEDLGMVPQVVPQVMNDLAILSLQVQRMPSDSKKRFSHPADAPYLSVVSPSSHDTSTLRQWWRENREDTQYFYNNLMGHYGKAPEELSPEFLEQILHQHLYSPAMLSVIPLQEFLGIDASLRNPDEDAERINIPAVFPHYWKYRMHIEIEQLLENENFSDKLNRIHQKSGRK